MTGGHILPPGLSVTGQEMKSGSRMRFIAVLASVAMMLSMLPSGCANLLNDDSAYSLLPESGWVYGDMVTFSLTHLDSVSSGELFVAVSHDSSYRYSNLWLEISSVEEDNSLVRDTVEFHMSDSCGNWSGTGLGPEIEVEIPVKHIRHVSGHPINIRHIMRCDTLRGISKVGLFFKSDTEDGTKR